MLNYLQELAKEYNMSNENVLSIALNRYGLIIPNYPDNRIRFNLKINGSSKNTFFAVCVNTFEDLDRELEAAKSRNELSLIEVKCSIGARDDLGRPTTTALENKENFMNYLNSCS